MKKISYIDVIRVISFGLIIYYHIVVELITRNFLTYETAPFYYNSNFHVATCAVALFFMVSGASLIVSSERKEKFSVSEYYKKRFFRILIPYYIASFASFAVICRFALPEGKNPWMLILNLFAMDGYASTLGADAVYLMVGEWFMGCLMILYLLFPLFRLLVVKWPVKTFVISTICYIFLIVFYPFEVNAYQNVLVKGYEFILGMFIVRIYNRIPKKILFITIPFIVLLFVSPAALPVKESFLITGVASAVFITLSKFEPQFRKLNIFNKVTGTICKFSYEIFLIHHAVIFVVLSWAFSKYGTEANIAAICVLTVVLIIISGIIIRYISKAVMKLIGYIAGKIKYKKTT